MNALHDRLMHVLGFESIPVVEDCSICGGGGLIGPANYDGVCGECWQGEVLIDWAWRWTAWGWMERPEAIIASEAGWY